MSINKAFRDGHFYSPIVNTSEIVNEPEKIWKLETSLAGIDFNDANHHIFFEEILGKHINEYNFPKEAADDISFFDKNTQFSGLDSRVLFCMLKHLKPRRMIEVGSGFSSLLVAELNRHYFDQGIDFTCIEPYPREFLSKGVPGISKLIHQKVQDVPLREFLALSAGDVLFIDSSHVAKTGSDVNYLYFEVIPSLAAGVYIHIHDIFLPREYPKSWVIEKGRSWNEQYILRAFLMYNPFFEIIFSCAYAFYKYPSILTSLFEGELYGGASIWLRKNISTTFTQEMKDFKYS